MAVDFTRNNPLPILAVDEPIYRRLPCFLIATVDKFAAMPWTGPVGGFFGRVDRHDKNGFYGPCEPRCRHAAAGPAAAARPHHPGRAAPDLRADGHDGRPVRIGPGRTVHAARTARSGSGPRSSPRRRRSAGRRTRSAPCSSRRTVDIFPPPGPDRRDSFFAHTHHCRREPRPALPGRGRPGTQPQGRPAAHLPGPARPLPRSGTRRTAGRRTRTTRPIRT